jgi:peptidoglycan/LPS O-acetylase OafA/YrhL
MTHAPADPPTGPGPRVPALDGLRAASIVLVLVAHAKSTAGFPAGVARALDALGDLGNLGVRVFFVISGYLITSLLVAELERAGRIDLVAFYVRRAIRIVPAFYAYLAVIVAAALAGVAPLSVRDAAHALTYTVNFEPARGWNVGHIWSLSVEEQFYLLWPPLLVALGLTWGLRVALAALVLAPLSRVAFWVLGPAFRPLIGEAFPTIVDALAVGCVAAAARGFIDRSPRYLAFVRSPAFWLVPAAALAVNAQAHHARLFFAVGETVVDLALAVTVDRVVRVPEAASTRVLASAPVVFVGVRSYSLYLWQQPFLDHRSAWAGARFPQNLALACAAAMASFHLVERPFQRLRARFAAGAPRTAKGARVAPGGA